MAAIAGLDPGPMTYGELVHACRAKLDFSWSQTSALMALIANRQRGKHERPYKPEDFYRPLLTAKRRGSMTAAKLRALKPNFQKRR